MRSVSRAILTASQFVGQITAIVREIAEPRTIDALLVRAGVLREGIARTNLFHAHRHVVLVGAVAAIVDSVA